MSSTAPDNSTYELYSSKIRLRIYDLLLIHGTLTLQEIADKLSRNKSSIHPHIQKLIKLGFVKPPKKIDENRNNLYETSEKSANLAQGIESSSNWTPHFRSTNISNFLLSLKVVKAKIEEYLLFFQRLQKMNKKEVYINETNEILQNFLNIQLDEKGNFIYDENKRIKANSKFMNIELMFDEEMYKEYLREYRLLLHKHMELWRKKKNDNPSTSFHYCINHIAIPLEMVYRINSRKDLP